MNSTETLSYRADQFAVGQFIDVAGVPSMSNLRIDSITFSAVHVTMSGVHTTISCATPCVPHVAKSSVEEDVDVAEVMEEITVEENVETEEVAEVEETKSNGNGKRGRPQGVKGKLMAEKLSQIVFPNEPFTMKSLVELTGIEQLYLFPYVNKFCVVVGEEEKVPGKRGRPSKLYKKKD